MGGKSNFSRKGETIRSNQQSRYVFPKKKAKRILVEKDEDDQKGNWGENYDGLNCRDHMGVACLREPGRSPLQARRLHQDDEKKTDSGIPIELSPRLRLQMHWLFARRHFNGFYYSDKEKNRAGKSNLARHKERIPDKDEDICLPRHEGRSLRQV